MSVEIIRHDAEVSPATMFAAGDMLYVLRAYDEYRERALLAERQVRELESVRDELIAEWLA